MAAIRRKRGRVAVACCSSVLYSDTGLLSGWQSVSLPEVKDVKPEEDDDTKPQNRPSGNGSNKVLASALSPTGRYYAVCDDQKQLHVFEAKQQWTLFSTRNVVRRGKSIAFTANENELVMADKSGDVYRFSLLEPNRPGELTHGHLSMILDMVLVRNDRYVVTCDRDEKIRISNYPNSYNIYSFCLGHTEFITSLCYVEEDDVLLSGSGDLTLRAWTIEGKQLSCMKPGMNLSSGTEQPDSEKLAVHKLTYCAKHRLLVVAFINHPKLEVYRLSSVDEGSCLTLTQTLDVPEDPWDVCYDEDGYLWVLQPVEDGPLQIYRTEGKDTTVQLKKITDEDEILIKLQTDINSKWDSFKGCLEVPNVVSTLWKQRIDNMAEYLERKQKRMAGDQGKGDNSDPIASAPPEKIAKDS